LRVGADGTYQYIADSSTGTDVFTYTLSDGTATHTATLTITINSGTLHLPHLIQQYTLMKITKNLQQGIEHHPILQKYLQQVILIIQTVIVIVYQK
jgi:hypothetical protein